MPATNGRLPRTWSLESYFPAFDSEAHRAFVDDLRRDLADQLTAAAALEPLAATTTDAWAATFVAWEELVSRLTHLGSYYTCLRSGDAANESYQAAQAALDAMLAGFAKLLTALRRGLRSGDDGVWRKFLNDPRLAGASYKLQRLRDEGRFHVGPPLRHRVGQDDISDDLARRTPRGRADGTAACVARRCRSARACGGLRGWEQDLAGL
jgi:oligoendopeptidase F